MVVTFRTRNARLLETHRGGASSERLEKQERELWLLGTKDFGKFFKRGCQLMWRVSKHQRTSMKKWEWIKAREKVGNKTTELRREKQPGEP